MTEGKAKEYLVRQGDCITSIAAEAGFFWQTIWNYPKNSELKNLRKDPNILLAGDVLIIPPKTRKEVSRRTEAKHKFVKKGTPAKITMRLLQEGKPRADISFIFTVDGAIHEGKTDTEGFLTFPIPPKAGNGKLSILAEGEIAEEYTINLGNLDPIEEITGIQKRLANLGFECRETGELDEQTNASIAAFRAKHNLQGEELNEEFRNTLKKIHGS